MLSLAMAIYMYAGGYTTLRKINKYCIFKGIFFQFTIKTNKGSMSTDIFFSKYSFKSSF